MFLKKYGKTKSAALKFTECLEIGKIYDPEIRKKCLEQLKEIFEVKRKQDLVEVCGAIIKN